MTAKHETGQVCPECGVRFEGTKEDDDESIDGNKKMRLFVPLNSGV